MSNCGSLSNNTTANTAVTSTSGVITVRFEHNRNESRNFSLTIYQECCGGGGAGPSTTYSCTGSSYQIGSGTSSDYKYGPVNNYYNYSYRQIIYTGQELDYMAGEVKAIGFQYAYSSAMTKKTNVTIYMANTTADNFASTTSWITTGLTEVYSGSMNFTSLGWAWIELTNTFPYEGGNLLVVIDDNSGAYDGSSYTFYYSGSTSDPYRQLHQQNDTYNYGNDNISAQTGTQSNYRPNTKFCIDHNCTPRTATFAFATTSVSVIAGESYTQNVTGGENVTYSMTCNPTGIATFNNTTHTVSTVAGSEGTVTVTATWPASDGFCKKTVSYTINVGDGCAQVGSGTEAGSYTPVYTYYSGYYSYTQQLYKASEIIAAGGCQGKINSIKFQYKGPSTYADMTTPVDIYIGTTSATSLSSGWVTDATLTRIHTGAVPFVSGWNTINLATPLDWDGVSNIVVAVRSTSTSYTTDSYFYYTSATGMARYASSSSTIGLSSANVPSSLTGTSSSYRPNIRFCIDCCDDLDIGTFQFDQSNLEYVIGSGAFTAPGLTNTTGMTGVTYSAYSESDGGGSVGSVNSSTGAVTFTGTEGYLTVTAKLAVAGGCDKYTTYRVFVNDGCRRIGNGTLTSSESIIDYYTYDWSQFIYKGNEINGGGTINRISVRAVDADTKSRTIKVYMCLTDKETFSSSTDFIPLADMTQVYSGTHTLSAGWNDFTLSRSFTVPCGKNLVIAFDVDCSSGYASEYFYATSVPSSGIRAYSDSENSPVADMSSYSGNTTLVAARPNIKLCMTECVCPELSFAQQSVTFCQNSTPQHPELECSSSGARTWTSSDASVVRITNATTGAMTIVGPGSCVITLNVAATGQYCAAAAHYKVRVIASCPTLNYNTTANCTGTATPTTIPSYTGYGVMTLSDVVPSCSTTGVTFAGWCGNADGSGSLYQPGTSFPLTRDTTLYAIYFGRCCHPDSATVTYVHQTVTFDDEIDAGYVVNPNQYITVERDDDGFFYYDLCLGENNGKIHAEVTPPDGCSYTNKSWKLEYADGTTLVSSSTGNTFEYTIDSVIGYSLTYRARSSDGCWLNINGRIRVSPGVSVENAHIPDFSVCPESYVPISIGLTGDEGVDVEVNRPGTNIQSTLGHAERIFLPDGVECDLNGDGTRDCGYVSSVTFTDFQNGAVVRSVEDILYLSMTIEHSFIGDLFIKVTCPNGQEATILKKYETGTSDCLSAILALSDNEEDVRGWQVSGSSGADFGIANSSYASASSDYACDSAYSANAIGTPWTYAWSNNSSRGYSYAGGSKSNNNNWYNTYKSKQYLPY